MTIKTLYSLAIFVLISGIFGSINCDADYVSQTRTYYIAAEDVEWDYAPSGKNLIKNIPINAPNIRK